MTNEELRSLMEQALAEHCSKDNNGQYFGEIYVDYRDELGEESIRAILKAEDPMQAFGELLAESYQKAVWQLESDMEDKLREDPALAAAYEENEELFRDTFHDLFYVNYPYDHFLNEDVEINIVLDTGDCNYDFVLNSFAHGYYGDPEEGVDEHSSLLWLCRQQGVPKEDLEQALQTGECYPKHISETMERHDQIWKEMKALGCVPDKPMDHYNQNGAFKTLLHAESLVQNRTRSIEKHRANLTDCALSYEQFCEKWLNTGSNRTMGRTPPSEANWATRRAEVQAQSSEALAQLETQLAGDKAHLDEVLKDPDVARAAQLREELKELNETYIPMRQTDEFKKGKFLESVIRESANTSSHMNALAALVKMPLREAINLNAVIRAEATLNDSYIPEERKGESSILLDKDTVLGLYDSWNGAGGLFEIELVKPLEVPVNLIFDANVDGSLGYGIESIDGGMEYSDSLQEIREVPPELTQQPLEQRLQAAKDIAAAQQVGATGQEQERQTEH